MIGIRRSVPARLLSMLALLVGAPAWAAVPAAPAADRGPLVDCYRTAADGSGDFYPCDLAVQIARDSGNRRELAAALANRAMVLANAQRYDAALQDLNDAVAAASDNADLHGNRGNLLLRMNRASEALAAHDRAVALAPRDPVVYYNRAFSHQALGDSAGAAADVEAARELLAGQPPITASPIRAAGARGSDARSDR